MADKKNKSKPDYDGSDRTADKRCFMAQYDGCKGYIIRVEVGLNYVDMCIRHAILLKQTLNVTLDYEGF